jgi:integrase
MVQARKNRRLGRGSISKYKTKNATLWRWQAWVEAPLTETANGRIRIGGTGYKTASEAETGMALGLAKYEADKAFKLNPQVPTFEEFAAKWLTQLKLAPATVSSYQRLLRCHAYPNLGKQKLNEITSQQLANTYKALSQHGRKDIHNPGGKLSPNTVNKVHVVIGTILEAAIDEGYIDQNPARRQRIVQAPTGSQIRAHQEEVKTWDDKQLKYFLNWNKTIYQDQLNTMWSLAAYTGMRRGEVVGLKWEDIDFENNIISIRRAADPIMIRQTKTTKTGRQRPVTIHTALATELKTHKNQQVRLDPNHTRPNSYVFGLKNGELRSPNDISARWARAMKKASAYSSNDESFEGVLPFLTLKGLRHTHATMLMRSGANPKIVQERLGHSTISTTMNIYSHVTPTMQREAVEALFERLE